MFFLKVLARCRALIIGAAVFALLFPFFARSEPQKGVRASGFVIDTRRVVVVDAGHGGIDGGAVSPGGLVESNINLDVALKLDAVLGFFGSAVVLTRDSGDIVYPDGASTIRARKSADLKARTELVNSTENALLISIHQNKYTAAGPHGAQVFYSDTPGSRELAVYMQEVLRAAVDPPNTRLAKRIGKDIYMMNHVNCTAVLVECGFLSNPSDAALLAEPRHTLKLASAVASACLSYYGGENES